MSVSGFTFDVATFEDRYGGGEDSAAPLSLLVWFREALEGFSDGIEQLSRPGVVPDTDPEIEVLICSRKTMDEIFGAPGALGVFVTESPEGDPFGDRTECAKRLRVAIVFDAAEAELRLAEEIVADGDGWEAHLDEYEESEAATLFHEIAHAALFARNSGMLSPQAVEDRQTEIGNDLFDMLTGYGVRPLPNGSGEVVWAESASDAMAAAEDWCERQGREWFKRAKTQTKVPFFEAAGIVPAEVAERAIRGAEPSP